MRVYIVAGEPSGDLLASGLMKALRKVAPDVEFRGVGGEAMTAAGEILPQTAAGFAGGDVRHGKRCFESLFDISEISVMGVFEVLPRLPLILKRINQTVNDIEELSPDVLVTVDSWGFVSALLTRLRKRASKVPKIHYVAPQVWAWKKGRAKNVARLVDRLMTLLPDEGRWFEPYGLRSDFVGHPVVERIAMADLDPEGFRAANGIPAGATVISVLPGSRHSEVKRLLPIQKEAVERIAADVGNVFVVVPTVPGVEDEVRRGFEGSSIPTRVVTGEVDRYNAFASSDLAISKSGTVSLELAALGVPHMIMYSFGRISDFIVKRLVKVRFANIINLLAGREIVPEFVLDRCRPDLIADCAAELLNSPRIAEKQTGDARGIMQKLRLPDILPSDRAAQIVMNEIIYQL